MRFLLAVLFLVGAQAFAYVNYSTITYPTATTSSTKILNVNNLRQYLIIQNQGAVGVYVSTATQTASQGILIPPGGSYEPEEAPINAIYVETASSTAALIVIQGQ